MTPRQMLVFMLETRENLDQQIRTLQAFVNSQDQALSEADGEDDKSGGVKSMAVATLKDHPPGEMVSDEEMAERQRAYLAKHGIRTPRH